MARTLRLIIAGLGNVNLNLLRILQSQQALLAKDYHLTVSVVAVCDSSGGIVDPNGLDIATLIATKEAKRGVATLPGGSAALVAQRLVEATPVNLQTAEPGLSAVRTALNRGMHAILANKGPLALAYPELSVLSDMAGDPTKPKLRFSACVGGALPTINLGRRDLAGTVIHAVEGVLNGTTQYILRSMERGGSYAEALKEAQDRGLAETDPTLDVEGWDAANKLTIVANAVLNQPTNVRDFAVTGITALTATDLTNAVAQGQRIVLLCKAERNAAGSYDLSVKPTALPADHPLARMSEWEMGVVYHTDISGRASATSAERGPLPTAAAMLRDLIDVSR
jgi:homoserine dehydrogenase